jgi:hypothetical protein
LVNERGVKFAIDTQRNLKLSRQGLLMSKLTAIIFNLWFPEDFLHSQGLLHLKNLFSNIKIFQMPNNDSHSRSKKFHFVGKKLEYFNLAVTSFEQKVLLLSCCPSELFSLLFSQ